MRFPNISNCLAYFFNDRHVGHPTQVESVSLAHYTGRLVGALENLNRWTPWGRS